MTFRKTTRSTHGLPATVFERLDPGVKSANLTVERLDGVAHGAKTNGSSAFASPVSATTFICGPFMSIWPSRLSTMLSSAFSSFSSINDRVHVRLNYSIM